MKPLKFRKYLSALAIAVMALVASVLATEMMLGSSEAQTFGTVRPGLSVLGLPQGAVPITASATGTTAATTATLTGVTGQNTYICGFRILANATGAATANATVTGTVTGTMNFTQWTAPVASGIGNVSEEFLPCIQSSAPGVSISVVSAAPGSGGVVSVTAWGFTY